MCEMDRDALLALVERAREDADFPGYFLLCQVGIRGVRSAYKWLDWRGVLRRRSDLEDDYESDLNEQGWNAGADDDLGSVMRAFDTTRFAEEVDAYIDRLGYLGMLFPLYYAD